MAGLWNESVTLQQHREEQRRQNACSGESDGRLNYRVKSIYER